MQGAVARSNLSRCRFKIGDGGESGIQQRPFLRIVASALQFPQVKGEGSFEIGSHTSTACLLRIRAGASSGPGAPRAGLSYRPSISSRFRHKIASFSSVERLSSPSTQETGQSICMSAGQSVPNTTRSAPTQSIR